MMKSLNTIALLTIIRKEVVRFMRIWPQTLVPSVINQVLYFIIFGTFIGSQVGDVNGIPYMAFIVPGLVMMAVINSSFSNVVSSFFGSKFQRSIEEMMVSPTPDWVIVTGYSMGGVLRGIIVGTLVFGVSAFFTRPEVYCFGLLFVFIFLTALMFSLGGLVNGIFAKKFDDVSIFTTFVLTPLTYFGGVFYSISDLPQIWQTISKFNPVLYMVDGFRYSLYGVADLNVWVSITVLVAFTLAFAGLNIYLLRKGIGLRS